MTEENPTDNIETLASRAKEMLERVRGAADPDAITPPPLPLSTSSDKRAEEDDADELESLDSDNTDAEDAELVELDDNELDELDAELDDTDVDEDVTLDEDDTDTGADTDTDTDTDTVDEAVDGDEPDFSEMEIVDFGDEIAIDEVELAEPLTSSADLDDADLVDSDTDTDSKTEEPVETANLKDRDIRFDAEDAESDQSLNLFGRQDQRDADADADADADETVNNGGDEFGPDDVGSDDILSQDSASEYVSKDADFDAPEEADAVIAELEDLEAIPVDADDDLLDLDDGDSVEIEGVGYLSRTDIHDAQSISTDDLIAESDDDTIERLQETVGLQLDNPSDDVDVDVEESTLSFNSKSNTEGVVTGEAVVAGSAIAGAAAPTATNANTEDAPDDETAQKQRARRDRGRLSDLGAKEQVAAVQPQSKGRFSRKPAVDHDLNDLFLKSNSPDQSVNQRSFPWLVPLGLIVFCFLAISVLFFSWWAAGGDDDTTNDNSEQVETIDSTDNTVDDSPDPTTVEAATPTTIATDTTTPTSTVEETATTFESAAELIGAGSNTADFANLGNALGLQQALEQLRVDENGDPVRFTLLAPSDAAIAKLTEEQLAELADPTKAGELIDYHFVDQSLTPEFLLENVGGQIMTRSGIPISIGLDGDDYVFNGEARVEIAGLEAENGSIIVIDSVLVPPTAAAAIEDVLDLGNVQFQTFQDVITDEGKAELANAVTYFNENPDVTAIIGGHTDSDGPADGNQRLSQRRANAVRQFLISAGIDGSRLEATGFGEEQPILIDGVEDKNLSRRIEFAIN